MDSSIDKHWQQFWITAGLLSIVAIAVMIFLPGYRNLAFLFFYSIPSNSVIPLPHEPALILFGKFYPPLLVALVASAGTLVACFLDYRAVNRAFRTAKLQKIRRSDIYRGSVHYFLKAPFLSIVAAAFAPFIPFYIVRVLSPTSGYPLRRYMLATFVGRMPRYYLFAMMGSFLSTPRLLLVGAVLLAVCWVLYRGVKHHLSTRKDPVLDRPEIPVRKARIRA